MSRLRAALARLLDVCAGIAFAAFLIIAFAYGGHSQSSFDLPYSGKQYLVLTGDEDEGWRLYAGGSHNWGDGVRFNLNELAADKLADVIADSVKSFLEG